MASGILILMQEGTCIEIKRDDYLKPVFSFETAFLFAISYS
jgi:hypothetical protein